MGKSEPHGYDPAVLRRREVPDAVAEHVEGIDPRRRRVLLVKSVHHFRAAYAPIAREVMVVDSGALCTPDPKRYKYRKLRRPILPLDEIAAPLAS